MADKEMVEAVESIANSIENFGYEHMNKDNAYGNTIGDELYNIGYQFSRIADALEKIANK